jgi:predicted patatin/cPLA2 family phospholipase
VTLKEWLSQNCSSNGDKPALVVQGGGMRGVYSVAALSVLEDLGLTDCFSMVIGSSAGAINGAYFLAGQANEGVDIYVETLSNSPFISMRRLGRIVDMDFLVDQALKAQHPLDVERVRTAHTPLYLVLTDADTGEGAIVSAQEDYDLYEVFRATGALPALYNKRIRLGGRDFVDGGVASAIPLMEAAELGARSALVVMTRRPGYRRHGHHGLYRKVGRAMARGQSDAVRARIGAPDDGFNRTMALLEASGGDRMKTRTVWPSDPRRLVSRTCADRGRLHACANMARDDMRRLLESVLSGEVAQ